MAEATPQQAAQKEVEKVEEAQGPIVADPSAMYVPPEGSKGPFYAWSRLIAERDEESGLVRKWIMEGDKVSAGDLGLDEDQWNELVESGAVRQTEYPVPKGSMDSPNDHYKKLLAQAAGQEVDQ